MKIPVDHVDLAELGYPDYWIEIPRSVKEGYLHEFAKMTIPKVREDGASADNEADATASRDTNIKIMELVTAWNIDDDAGKIFPVMSKIKTKPDREKVISEIPVDIIVFVAQRISGTVNVPEKTKDF